MPSIKTRLAALERELAGDPDIVGECWLKDYDGLMYYDGEEPGEGVPEVMTEEAYKALKQQRQQNEPHRQYVYVEITKIDKGKGSPSWEAKHGPCEKSDEEKERQRHRAEQRARWL